MLRELQKMLSPVRRRLALRKVAAALATGLVLGGWLALVAGLMALLGRSYWAAVAGMVAVIAVPFALVLRAMLKSATWNAAAQAVDRHFELQDRTATALYLTEHGGGDLFAALQIEDAAARLAPLALRQAVPLQVSWQRLCGGVLLCALALGLLAASYFLPDLRSLRGSAPVVVEHGADVIDRIAVALPAVDESVARRSAQFAGSSKAQLEGVAGDDIAGRYFDRLQTPRANK